jgi:hypothetical protein
MPWHTEKRGSKWCVIKDGTSSPVPGGCHPTRAEAVKHQRALYASEASAEGGTVMNVEGETASNGESVVTVSVQDVGVYGRLTFDGVPQGELTRLPVDSDSEPAKVGLSVPDEWEKILGSDGEVIGFRFPDGVTLEETQPTELAEEAPVESQMWEGPLGVIGHPTSDKRFLIPEEIGNRELPLPLNVQVQTDEGHDSSLNAGRINTIELIRMGDFEHAAEFALENVPEDAIIVWGTGEFDGSPAAEEAKRLIENGYGVSLDLPPDRIAYFDPETFAEIPAEELDEEKVFFGEYLHGIAGQIAGATVVNIPAFSEATIRLSEDMVLVASAGQIRRVVREPVKMTLVSFTASAILAKPDRSCFEDPHFRELTPLTIGDPLPSGYRPVYGHLADWDGCHTGFTNVCVPPFRSNSHSA